ncbi:MAG: lipid A deacylase LpxR family protein [Gammaproteobacteria bacterium]|nr:lipid A deacylase LpxR family protein [Gammaproteobacteria bacterium]
MSVATQSIIPFARQVALLLVAISCSSPGTALDDDEGFWSIQLENDLWGSNEDRFYTHGWQFSYASPEKPPGYLEAISDAIPFYAKGETGYHGFNLGQTIFTPEDITTPSLQVDDRPYAGWLYLETFIGHRYFDRVDREKINGFILTIGIVGPASLAEGTQKLVHDLVDGDDPAGWDNQLENELGINGSFIQKWRHIFDFDERLQTEVSMHGGLTLGNVYTYAAAGIMARWGRHLKDDIGPPSISPGFPGLPAFNPNRRANWYFFAAVEVRAVARNIFLDGNSNVDSHSVEKKKLVSDLQIGVAIHYGDARVSFGQTLRSREFEGQSEPSQYGLINFTYFVE